MGEEEAVALAKIVAMAREDAIFGALAVASKEPRTLTAVVGKLVLLDVAKGCLLGTIHHLHQMLFHKVSQFVLREDKVVTGIDIAVPLHDGCMATGTGHGADAWRYTTPVGKGGIKELDKHFAHIAVRHPFVENRAKEIAPLSRGDG